jgi:hypothetical protein
MIATTGKMLPKQGNASLTSPHMKMTRRSLCQVAGQSLKWPPRMQLAGAQTVNQASISPRLHQLPLRMSQTETQPTQPQTPRRQVQLQASRLQTTRNQTKLQPTRLQTPRRQCQLQPTQPTKSIHQRPTQHLRAQSRRITPRMIATATQLILSSLQT